MSSWLVVGSPENFARTRDLGFSMQGFKTRQRRKVMEQMRPGDNLVYYVSGVQAFAATASIGSEGFEDHEQIWKSKPGEDYPYRVKISPDMVLDEADWVPSESVGPGLVYVQKWPTEHWKLAFQGNLRQIPDEDFSTLRDAITAARRA
ncbi:MAG TPA: EVE domain-containing protein [Acidimicrobiia bacterium]|nr:EVE domain-containing protein [Acidimicrobiia bacterium]